MLLEESLSGQLNSAPSTLTSSHAQPSSRMVGESTANSNRTTRALGDVFRQFTQARGRRCRGTLDLSEGRTTQVRPVDFLEGLKQRSRVRSYTTWAPPAISLGIKRLLIYGDSAVVINQVNKSWDRNKENMDAYCLEVRKLETNFMVSSSITSSVTTMLQQTSCRSLVLLARKYPSESSSMNFMRQPSRSQRPRPLTRCLHNPVRSS
jgi:hypothetical protein